MKKTIYAGVLMLLATAPAMSEEVTYSNEAYCLLEYKLGKQDNEVKAYARQLKRLGVEQPSKEVCQHFVAIMRASLAQAGGGKEWNYRNNAPYPGSGIRLTNKQVEKLKAARGQN